jgi:hypothetical protein
MIQDLLACYPGVILTRDSGVSRIGKKLPVELLKGERVFNDQKFRAAAGVLENVGDISKLVFFVGAGMSVPAGYPLWGTATQAALNSATEKGLVSEAAAYAQSKFHIGQYYEVFEILQNELPEAAFYEIAERVFAGGEQPAETHLLLTRIKCRGIITTNFDACLESAAVLEGRGLPLGDLPQAMASDKFFVLSVCRSPFLPHHHSRSSVALTLQLRF